MGFPHRTTIVRCIGDEDGVSHDMPVSDRLPKERAASYRRMAADAEEFAVNAPALAANAYRRMAEHWRKLADEIEPGANNPGSGGA